MKFNIVISHFFNKTEYEYHYCLTMKIKFPDFAFPNILYLTVMQKA